MPAMARHRRTLNERPPWAVHSLGLALAVTQLLVLPGAYSAFRLPKVSWALGVIALLVTVLCFRSAWRERLEIPSGPLALVLISLPLLHAISAVWSVDAGVALQVAAISAVWIAGALALSSLSRDHRQLLILWVAAAAAVSCLVLLAQAAGVPMVSLPGHESGDRLRLTGLAGNPADLAMAAVLLLPLTIPLLARPGRTRRFAAAIVAILVISAAATATLTALAALVLLGAVWLVLTWSRRSAALAAVVLVVAGATVIVSPLRQRLENLGQRIQEGHWYGVLSARSDGWTAAFEMIRSKPVTGVGAGQYSRHFFPARSAWLETRSETGHRGETATHFEWAHNDPLGVAAELGIVGLLWTVALAVAVVRIRGPDPRFVAGAIAVWFPFLMLHYPGHVAVGLLPAVLTLADFLAHGPRRAAPGPPIVLWIVALLAAGGTWWVVQHHLGAVRLDLWRGAAENAILAVEHAPQQERGQVLSSIEQQAAIQIARHPSEAGWIWRVIGKARLAEGRWADAEGAFRRARALFPHEEASFGLAVALLRQNRTSEAFEALLPVVRANPTLIREVPSESLRKALRKRIR